jgi:hypothetical protein
MVRRFLEVDQSRDSYRFVYRQYGSNIDHLFNRNIIKDRVFRFAKCLYIITTLRASTRYSLPGPKKRPNKNDKPRLPMTIAKQVSRLAKNAAIKLRASAGKT